MLTSHEIRHKFLQFFEKRGHAILPSASLIPENDPSVLFNTAGMQPLAPYLLGEKHPLGARLADAQKCVRTVDIDEVGDNTHATFFEMLGNWSLGDYFKEDAIRWSYEFLTSTDEGLGLDPRRLYVTVFEGDENAPRDEEAYALWQSIFKEAGVEGERIYFLGAKSNWWSAGDNGPCGPDTEMFYDVTGAHTKGLTHDEYLQADDKQEVVEIWNDVFMEYERKDGEVVGKLAMRNVDTGSGLERVTMVVQEKSNIFDTDIFEGIFKAIDAFESVAEHRNTSGFDRARRIIADHIRTSVFMVSDGAIPSNKDQGYILRRLLRRTVRLVDRYFENASGLIDAVVVSVAQTYASGYPEVSESLEHIRRIIKEEREKFEKALHRGNKEAMQRLQAGMLTGKDAFELFTTYGFPLELTKEIARDAGVLVNDEEFAQEFAKHQDLSRAGSVGKFKGGLADHGEMSVKYHTATHLLQQALRTVLGTHVMQRGSNITSERLRFDFSHSAKMTPDEIHRTEALVNEKIAESLPVTYRDIPHDEARNLGAIGLFGEKYDDIVRVYSVGDFSLEFCGGPHVTNTSELGTFSIIKEEASSAGIRRIKAVLR